MTDTPSRAGKRRYDGVQSGNELGHTQYRETISAKLFLRIPGAASRVGSEPAEKPHSLRTPLAAKPEPCAIARQATQNTQANNDGRAHCSMGRKRACGHQKDD